MVLETLVLEALAAWSWRPWRLGLGDPGLEDPGGLADAHCARLEARASSPWAPVSGLGGSCPAAWEILGGEMRALEAEAFKASLVGWSLGGRGGAS